VGATLAAIKDLDEEPVCVHAMVEHQKSDVLKLVAVNKFLPTVSQVQTPGLVIEVLHLPRPLAFTPLSEEDPPVIVPAEHLHKEVRKF
jgi:hypothetical protein